MSKLTTYTGQVIDPMNPSPESINLTDIAHSLSLMVRANGHYKHFYSIGQHSVNVARELARIGCEPLIQIQGLLHDSSEAYLADIIKPVKIHLPDYIDAEERFMSVIWQAFGLPEPTDEQWEIVKYVDDTMLANEASYLMLHHWDLGDYPIIPNADLGFRPMESVEHEFVELFGEIVRNLSIYDRLNEKE